MAGRFRGILDVDSGAPVGGGWTTTWQPDAYGDVWEPRFPAHDYPMPCAEACLRLHRLTGRTVFAQGVER